MAIGERPSYNDTDGGQNGKKFDQLGYTISFDESDILGEKVDTTDQVKEEVPTENASEKSFKWSVLKTLFLFSVWICLGLCGEITGPTLLDLKLRTHSNYESVSTGVSGRSAGFFIGSAIGGVLVDKFGVFCDLIVALSLDGIAMATVAIPWMPTTNLIFVLTLLQGTMEGLINIAGQKMMINMWKDKATGPLHLLHGGFGIGSLIIPLIANPFLALTRKPSPNTTDIDNVTSMTLVSTTPEPISTTEGEDVVIRESKMEYAYIIAAIITVGVSIVFFVYHVVGSKDRSNQKKQNKENVSGGKPLAFREMFNPATCTGGYFFYGVQIFIFVFLYFIQCAGGERVAGKFVRTYSIKYLDFSEDDGSYINTVFWAAFAVGRMLGFVTGRFIPIRILIMLETGGCLITAILLVIFGGDSAKMLWILMPILGFFIAPLFPSGVGWANYHIEMTGISITFFMLGGSVGGLIYMKLTGYLFDHYGYRTFLYLLLGSSIAAVVFSSLMNIIAVRHGSTSDKKDNEVEIAVKETEQQKRQDFENKAFKGD